MSRLFLGTELKCGQLTIKEGEPGDLFVDAKAKAKLFLDLALCGLMRRFVGLGHAAAGTSRRRQISGLIPASTTRS